MTTLYIYDNNLLGDDGTEYNDTSFVDSITCPSSADCLEKFEADYGSNDYTASFTKHQ